MTQPLDYLPGIPFICTLRDGTDLLITVFCDDAEATIEVARRFDSHRWSAPMDSVRRAD